MTLTETQGIQEATLEQNYPNPVLVGTTILLFIPKEAYLQVLSKEGEVIQYSD